MTSSAWKELSIKEKFLAQQLFESQFLYREKYLDYTSGGIRLPTDLEKSMPTVVSPVPSLNIYQDDAGNIAGSFAAPASISTGASTVNWAALLQWLATYGPSIATAIAALIAAFGSPTPPPPAHIETRS
jgi:hypothetical protein